MKKILSVTITLCLIFASVLPIYAEAWTSNQAQNVTTGVAQILAQLLQLNAKFGDIDGSGRGVFDNILLELEHLAGWLVPDGARGASDPTLMDSIVVLVNYAMNHLPDISSIASYVSSWMQTNNTLLGGNGDSTLPGAYIVYRSAPYADLIVSPTRLSATGFTILSRDENGAFNYTWNNRTPTTLKQALNLMNNNIITIGSEFMTPGTKYLRSSYNKYVNGQLVQQSPYITSSIMDFLFDVGDSIHLIDTLYYHSLKDYTGQLGIWDSQGETLTQEGWSPTSAINGLYKYLAYTQRDVARLTYVLASDEEIATREKARETQTAVMDDFIDPEGGAAASTENFGEIASGSANVQQNFSTGYSVSNMWGAFGSEHYGWFSQECADALDTSAASTSGNRLLKNDKHNESDYDTPLLDEYYREILSLGGGNDD